MAIFKKKKAVKPEVKMAAAPESQETPGEIKHIEALNEPEEASATLPTAEIPEVGYREVPVCMSQEQINNLVIENNIMLKQIITEID